MDQNLTQAIFGDIDEKKNKSETDGVTKNIVYGAMVVSLIFPIIMAVFLVMTLNDIDFGESIPSCTAPFFTNPSGSTDPNPTSASGGDAFSTKVKLPNGTNPPLDPYPCQKK